MRKLLFSVLLLLGSAIYSKADPVVVQLKLMNVSPYNSDGRVYVYPYNFSINDSSTLTSLLCDDYFDEIYIGEYWKAYAYGIGDVLAGKGQMDKDAMGNPTSGPAGSIQTVRNRAYKEAAWLYQQLVVNPGAAVKINHTIWALFANTTAYFSVNTTPGSHSWFDRAQDATAGMTDDQAKVAFANVVFYTPLDGSQMPSTYGRPQEFIGIQVPEPSSILALGMGLVCIGILVRRRNWISSPE